MTSDGAEWACAKWLVAGVALLVMAGSASLPARSASHLKVALVPVFKSSDCTAGADAPALRYFHQRERAREWLSAQLGSPIRRVVLPRGMAFIGLSSGTHGTTGYGMRVGDDAIRTAEGLLLLQSRWVRPGPDAPVLKMQTATCLLLGVPNGGYSAIRVLDQQGRTRLHIAVDKTAH